MRNLKKEEMQERRAPTVTGGRFTAREADTMGEGEDILRRSDLIGRLIEATEEVAESAVVGVRGAVGAGAALFLGEEGVERALPARGVGIGEDGRQGLSGGHGGLLDEEERPHDLCSGLRIYQALCVNNANYRRWYCLKGGGTGNLTCQTADQATKRRRARRVQDAIRGWPSSLRHERFGRRNFDPSPRLSGYLCSGLLG